MAVAGGVAHATAYGSGTRQCKVKSWGPVASGSPDLRVLVKCFDVTGALADSMFMASFTAQSGTNTQPMAYLLADRPTVASYTANQTYSYNSKGVLNTITRTGVGAYTARLGWVGGSGGHVQVTAFGDSSVRCKVARWAPVSVGFGIVHEDVSVRCFSSSGAPADSVFTLTYANNIGLNGSFDYAYMWADQPSTPSYVPSLPYQANSQPSIDAVQRLGVGHYVATFPGHPLVAGDVQVTAYGTSPTYCKVASLAAYPGVEVRCFDTHGAPVDSQFDATQFTSSWIL
jgi:hypothetical protein